MMHEISNTAGEMTVSCENLYESATHSTTFTNDIVHSLHNVADGAETQRIISQQSEVSINSLQQNIH